MAPANVTPERWQYVARIYELAVDLDGAARNALLSEACAADEALRREVESLLRQDATPVVVDRPVWATAARLFDDGPDLRPGATLGPYRIESPLGVGGMGEVFRATDTRLNRQVAIKVLPTGVALDPQMRARFGRESRAGAALTHPHICTLYDVGRHDEIAFIVLEYLEGDTLAARLANGRLSVDDGLTYAIQIASAIDYAHRHEIVHRDLKPANIMLTTGGAKLLDFGLAKFRAAHPALHADVTGDASTADVSGTMPREELEGGDVHATRDGTLVGTLRYMAPEQIAGGEADNRSDVFSFGAVLFEMLTGRRAFEGDNTATIRAAVLTHEPPPVSPLQPLIPRAIDDIVRRCLAKDPDERWQTAGDVLRELKRVSESRSHRRTRQMWIPVAAILFTVMTGLAAWLFSDELQRWSTAPAPGPIRSIAVLPIDDLSGDPVQQYFAEGITEHLITDLSTLGGGLRVISRTSVMPYRNTPKSVPTIARELRVDAIVEASIIRTSDRVRITAKLIRGATGEIIRTHSFERHPRDVLALSSDVARTIISNVDGTLTSQQQARLTSARRVDPERHRQVLLGRHHLAKATEEGLRTAVRYFDTAIAQDPDNALAHAGLAEAYADLAGFYLDPREAMPKAKRAAEAALRLDESLADAHAALGYVHLVYDWDGPAAQKELLRALELNPTLAKARLHYASYLTTQARNDEAVRQIQRAIDLDPRSSRSHAFGTVLLLFTRRYDEAIELSRRGLEFEPTFAFTIAFQGVAYAEKGLFDQAVDNLQRAAQLDNSLTILALQAHVLAVAGRKAEAEKVIRHVQDAARHRYFCPYEIATAYVSLGELDTAYDLFRKGTEERADCMAWLGVEPWIEPFRSDPRYASLLREIGLDPRVR